MTEDKIEFVIEDEHYGEVPEPEPASNVMPDWYEEMDMYPNGQGEEVTVRACMSFLDALTMGWILKLPSNIYINCAEDGSQMYAETEYDRGFIESHGQHQIGGDDHPMMPGPIIKFISPWTVNAPEGVSFLVTKPFNRVEERFSPFTGIVDADLYFNNANIPALWHKNGWEGELEKGTPIAQLIPYHRDGIIGDASIRTFTEDEKEEKDRVQEMVSTTQGFYRQFTWAPKTNSRVVDREE